MSATYTAYWTDGSPESACNEYAEKGNAVCEKVASNVKKNDVEKVHLSLL
jgi:hypothetical protein